MPDAHVNAVELLHILDREIVRQRICKAVLDDSARYRGDELICQTLEVMTARALAQEPYWELRCVLRFLARMLRPRDYLEIGNRTGWSLLQVAREVPGVTIVGFDLWMERYASSDNSAPERLRELLRHHGHSGRLTFVSGSSHVTLPAFLSGLALGGSASEPAVDLVTVDGDHSLEGARSDLELCAGLVRPGGAIVFDDLIHDQHQYLRQLWHDFAGAHPEFICVENTRDFPGTGVGFRRPLPAFLVQRLTGRRRRLARARATPAPTHATSLLVEHIGYLEDRVVSLCEEARLVRLDLSAREAGTRVLEEASASLRQQLDLVKRDQAAKDDAIQRLSRELEAVRVDQTAKEEAIQRLSRELAAVRGDQTAKEEATQRLSQELAAVRGDQTAKERAIRRLSQELAAVRVDQTAKEEAIKRLSRELEIARGDQATKEEAIQRLSRELAAVRVDQTAKEEAIQRLSRELAAVRGDQTAKEDAIQWLSQELEAVRSDRAAKSDVVERLLGEIEVVRNDQRAKEKAITNLQGMVEAQAAANAQLGAEIAEYRSLAWGIAEAALGVARWARRHFSRRSPASRAESPARPSLTTSSNSRLRVALDALQVQFGVSGGVEVYMKTLVRALLTRGADVQVALLCTDDQEAHLRSLFGDAVAYQVFRRKPVITALTKLRSFVRREPSYPAAAHAPVTFARLRESGIDVLHSPAQIFSCMDFAVPGVLNLHDLQQIHHPENFTAGDLEARNRLYRLSSDLAAAVIASSDFIRNDIIASFGVPSEKVFTIPVAYNPDITRGLDRFTPEDARRRYVLPGVFGFYPAQFWLHKNHARLIEALALARAKAPQSDLKLVFSGYRGLSGWPKVEEALERHGVREHVILLDFVPTEHLGAIYKLATFCIMPSLFEASSYPVIEAQTLGCPAMCSNITSLPELVADGAGLLFDPYSPEDMAAKMVQWLASPDDRKAHAERGQRRALAVHSVDAYVERLLAIYNRLIPRSQ